MPRLPSSIAAESPAGPPPMIEDGHADGLDGPGRFGARSPGVDPGELRQAFDRLDANSRPDELHAGLHGDAVGQDEALGALAVGAEDALGRAVLGMMAEDADARGEERGGQGLAFQGLERAPPPREGDLGPGGDGQDGVLVNAVHGQPISYDLVPGGLSKAAIIA